MVTRQDTEPDVGLRSLFREILRLTVSVEIVVVGSNAGMPPRISLHVWRKTLRGGMPAILPTTKISTKAKKRRKSRNRDIDYKALSAFRLVANTVLFG